MKKTFKVLVYGVLALFALGLLLAGSMLAKSVYRRSVFIDETRTLFSRVETPSDLEKLGAEYRPDLIYIRKFENGDWVAVRYLDEDEVEHGFTAAVMRYGDGQLLVSRVPFSGYEGMSGAMNRIEADTPQEFLSVARARYAFLELGDDAP